MKMVVIPLRYLLFSIAFCSTVLVAAVPGQANLINGLLVTIENGDGEKVSTPLAAVLVCMDDPRAIEALAMLKRQGLDFNAAYNMQCPGIEGGKGFMPCRLLISAGTPEMCEFLVHNGADVNAYGNSTAAITALINAVRNDNVEIVKTLIKLGANVHLPEMNAGLEGGYIWTPLRFANSAAVARVLVEAGAADYPSDKDEKMSQVMRKHVFGSDFRGLAKDKEALIALIEQKEAEAVSKSAEQIIADATGILKAVGFAVNVTRSVKTEDCVSIVITAEKADISEQDIWAANKAHKIFYKAGQGSLGSSLRIVNGKISLRAEFQ